MTQKAEKAAGVVQRFMSFTLGAEEYAIPLLRVKEVIAMTDTTPVPYAPGYFKGIMNLRGQIISVIDLRMKFKMPKADLNLDSAIVILDLAPYTVGVVVDSVNNVLALAEGEVSVPPELEGGGKSELILGVTRRAGKLILILDIERVLNLSDLKTMKRANVRQVA
jgi:purine-binding chemotaxis protein CheW